MLLPDIYKIATYGDCVLLRLNMYKIYMLCVDYYIKCFTQQDITIFRLYYKIFHIILIVRQEEQTKQIKFLIN